MCAFTRALCGCAQCNEWTDLSGVVCKYKHVCIPRACMCSFASLRMCTLRGHDIGLHVRFHSVLTAFFSHKHTCTTAAAALGSLYNPAKANLNRKVIRGSGDKWSFSQFAAAALLLLD